MCFFLRVDSGLVTFFTTLSLSQNAFVAPLIGIPNICNLYHNASFISTAIFKAMNSDPKVDDSIVFCHFEYHLIGPLLIKKMIPVVECLVFKHVACTASQNMLICTSLLLSSGISVGIGSSAPG